MADSDVATRATITHPDGRRADVAIDERDLVGRRLRQFRVVERLGAGGMGVVYKAIDEKLDRPVALKVLAERYLIEDASRRMLLQEARSAAAVAHRNVAAIHEVNENDDVSFIAMEYVAGETLRARLSAGPLPLDEVVRYAREIAAGLQCAHATGIVHRDLKPDNAMVTADGHIKLLDFGLARPLEPAAAESSQRVAGTPAYMSPEQARGEAGDPRSDVFAFGATLFELVTGAPPFDRGSARPSEWEAPRDWTPRELPRRGRARGLDAIIMRCLAYRAEDRYADGGELAAALAALERHRPSRARRASVAVGIVAALGAGAAYAWWPRASPAPPPRAVAFVVTTQGVPPDQQWIATAAERRAVAELEAVGRIRVVATDRTADHPSARLLADPAAGAAARRLANDLGVDRSVVLHATTTAGALAMTATIYNAAGDRTAELRAAGRADDAIALAAQLAGAVREQLGVAPAESLDSARAALPRTAEAARHYAEGLALRRAYDIDGAQRAFEAARDLDPDAPLVHDELAELWTYMGYEERAAAENRRALELAAPLRREDRLRLEARSAVLAHAWDKAIDAYRALSLLIPDELDDALATVQTMIDAGRVDDAATAIDQVARRPGGGTDARVTELRARIASLRGNRALARDLARAARARALAVGHTALVTQAELRICADAAQSGEPAEAEAACQRALGAHRRTGDVVGEADVIAVFARNLLELGRLPEARVLVADAEHRVRAVGPSRGLVRLLNTFANIEQKSSNNAHALVLAREATAIARALANPAVLTSALGSLASAELEAGHAEPARDLYREAIAVAKGAGLWATAARHLQNLALSYQREGRYADGLPHIEEALGLFRRVHESYDIAWALDTAGLIAVNMNELAKAQAFEDEALAVRLKNQLIGGQSRQNVAEVLFQKGDIAHALAEAQQAVDEFHRSANHGEVFALELLARCQLARGDARAALATADHALATEDPSRVAYLQAMLAPTRARARYALGERAAIGELARLVAATPTGPDSFGFRQALGELLVRDGDRRRGRAMLAALVTEARTVGDGLTAAQSTQLLATLPR
jgi:eukaryotic-like serine/threonine-protein kinase